MSDTPLDIAPFSLLSAKEQWYHIQRWHIPPWGINSKSRKGEMEAFHEKSHFSGTSIRGNHTHTAVAPKESQSRGELAALDLTKPLAATQRKALRELVENDFQALKAEINQFADDMARQKREEIQAEWAAKGADQTEFLVKGRELMSAYRLGVDELVLAANRAGVQIVMPALYTREIEVKVPGVNDAIKRAEADVEADRRRALNTLERARLTAQRKVLMTGVSKEALEILDTIPNARTLMVQAAEARTAPQSVTA